MFIFFLLLQNFRDYVILLSDNMDAQKRKIFHSRPLFYGFLALMLAMTTTRYVFAGDVKYIVFVGLVLVAFIAYAIWSKKYFILLITLVTFLFGCGWYFVGIKTAESKVYEGNCVITGRVSDDYSIAGYYASATLKDVTINGNEEKNISATFFDYDEELGAGDIIAFEAKVNNVHFFELESFRSDYYRDGVAYEAGVNGSNVVVTGNSLDADESFRLKMKDVLYESMGEENGAVAFAVLFGDKTDVDHSVLDSYKMSGVVHLLTVSGLHVGFLITLLGFILKLCHVKRWWNLLVCSIFLGLYAWLCGFSPSILRAGVMGLVLLATKYSGKCYDQLNSLGLAGILIILISPLSALDVGFQMSFFCVLGIFVVSPWLTKLFRNFLPKFVAESFAISLASQIGIMPFLGEIFSVFNFLSFFINLLVIPLFSILYPMLFVGAFATLLMPFMRFILKICGFGLDFTNNIANFFSSTRLIMELEPINVFLVLVGFVLLFMISKFFMANKKAKRVSCSVAGVLFAIVGGISFVQMPQQSSLVYAYNHSTQVVVLTTSGGETAIVDLGYENFAKRIFDLTEEREANTLFLLLKDCDIERSRAVGVETVIRCTTAEGYDEEVCVAKDDYEKIGGFDFCYRTYDNKLFGLEIAFDQTKVFIVSNPISENAIANLNNQDYDFVILGKYDKYSSLIDENINVLGYYRSSQADVNYSKHGNVKYSIDGKKYSWRCLDWKR